MARYNDEAYYGTLQTHPPGRCVNSICQPRAPQMPNFVFVKRSFQVYWDWYHINCILFPFMMAISNNSYVRNVLWKTIPIKYNIVAIRGLQSMIHLSNVQCMESILQSTGTRYIIMPGSDSPFQHVTPASLHKHIKGKWCIHIWLNYLIYDAMDKQMKYTL